MTVGPRLFHVLPAGVGGLALLALGLAAAAPASGQGYLSPSSAYGSYGGADGGGPAAHPAAYPAPYPSSSPAQPYPATPSGAYGPAPASAPSGAYPGAYPGSVPSAAYPSGAYATPSSPAPLSGAPDAPDAHTAAPETPAAPAPAAAGPVAPADAVRDIRVVGNQRIEAATVESYLLLKRGDPFDTVRMDRSLKDLFATGLFSNVLVRRDGTTLVVEVEENPVINQLVFEGNSKLDDDKLGQEIDLRPRVVFTRTKVQNAVRRILELYQRSGRFGARVEPKIVRLPQNRVDLIFEIDEGDVTGIKKINFVGNTKFSDFRLSNVIATKQTAWWRFLSSSDTYDPDRLAFDRDALRRFYLQNGYADFTVISAVAEMAPDRSGFYITFTVEEGERYKIGSITINSEIKRLTEEQLRPLLTIREGDWYDGEEVEFSIDNFSEKTGELGYAFVDIRPRTQRDRENRKVNITFQVSEAPRVYIERINIVGNTRTLDRVVRREFRVVEGDAFNQNRLDRTETRVKNLGFFEDVKLKVTQGSRPDLAVVDLSVKEQATGEFSLGAGFSSSNGALGTVGVRERNFRGRGQDLRANVTIAQRVSSIDLGFTEPYFLNRDVAAGVDLFRIDQDNEDESSFTQKSLGMSIRFGYNLAERLRHTWSYTLRTDDIDIDENVFFVSPLIRDQEGKRSTSAIAHALGYDTRDDRFDPTKGWFASLSNSVAGLGGGERYVRSELRGGYWYPIEKDWVASVSARAGYVFGFKGRNVRINNRFFLGGDSLRGFENAGVGPRDLIFDDSLGGNQVYNGTVELRMPTPLPEELGITARIFSDVGLLKGLDETAVGVVDTGTIRATAGFGLTWKSPFGPVRVDFGRPIKKEDFDDEELVRISFGTRF